MKPQMILTCNPSPLSFLREWVDWWLLPEGHEHAGRADPDKCGVRRWFIRIDNEMVWGDSREELIDKFGEDVLPLSMTMIGANIFDNPPLIKANPSYLANLQGLKRVRKERDLYGNWNIREETSGFWKSEWCTEILEPPHPSQIVRVARAYDIAGSKKSETTPNPDYTASVKMAVLKDGNYVILDVTRMRGTYGEVHKHIIDNAKRDGTKVEIVIPQDAGAAGKAAAKMMQLKISEEGFSSKTRPTNKSKIERFRPFCGASEAGSVSILKGCANDLENNIFNNNDFFYAELENFTASRNQKDDMVDSVGDIFMFLAQSKKLPNFMHGLKQMNLSTPNPINNIPFG
jgi:predicted phage terminase large subunit-like protein